MIHSLIFLALWFGSPDIKLVYNGETVSFLVLLIFGAQRSPVASTIQLEHLIIFNIKALSMLLKHLLTA